VLNWQSFNIAAGETTHFQPAIHFVRRVERINDQNPSQIYGSLQANGLVVLMNASGFYFGRIHSSRPADSLCPPRIASRRKTVAGAGNSTVPHRWPACQLRQIKIGNGGSAFLIADKIENHGNIEAPGGTVGLAAGQTVLLSERPDGRGMSMRVTLPQGSVDNEGRLIADGGTIAMNARW